MSNRRNAAAATSAVTSIRLGQIAIARSGDKGNSANIGVIAVTPAGFEVLRVQLTAAVVQQFFSSLGVESVDRYELPNLGALNFVLHGALAGGGSLSLRVDAQGKALGQAILEMQLDVPTERLPELMRQS
jgi:hypothetical protein